MIGTADAGIADCATNHAPAPYNTATCAAFGTPICTNAGTTLRCSVETCVGGSQNFAAVNYAGADAVSVFGTCDNGSTTTNFCCVQPFFSAAYDGVELVGSKSADINMGFRFGSYELAEYAPNSMFGLASGGNGDDTLLGSNRNAGPYSETLRGDKGIDTLRGGGGNDVLYGGSGDDVLHGDAGADKMYGEDGHDTMHGGTHVDKMYGGDGDDIMNGNGGNDTMYGEDDTDTMNGNNGHDTMYGGEHSDIMDGNNGNDNLIGGGGDDNMTGGFGADWIHGGTGHDFLFGNQGNDVLYGSFGNDTLIGHENNDFLCETDRVLFGTLTCPDNTLMSSGTGAVLGDDRAWIERTTGTCGVADPFGNNTIFEARDTAYDWSDVLILNGTVVPTSDPWPDCALIQSKWGY